MNARQAERGQRLWPRTAVHLACAVQVLLALSWLSWLAIGSAGQSDFALGLQFYSFFAMVPLCIALLVVNRLYLRPVRRGRDTVLVRATSLLTGICAGIAVAFAGVFTFAAIVFSWADF